MESKKDPSTILDEIAKDKGIEVSDDPFKDIPENKNKQIPQKIAVVAIMLGIYLGLMIPLLTTGKLIFLLLVIVFLFVCVPLVKFLKKLFKIQTKSDLK